MTHLTNPICTFLFYLQEPKPIQPVNSNSFHLIGFLLIILLFTTIRAFKLQMSARQIFNEHKENAEGVKNTKGHFVIFQHH